MDVGLSCGLTVLPCSVPAEHSSRSGVAASYTFILKGHVLVVAAVALVQVVVVAVVAAQVVFFAIVLVVLAVVVVVVGWHASIRNT